MKILWSGIDTLHVTIPAPETVELAAQVKQQLGDGSEAAGLVNGQAVVLRRGGSGYQYSIWRGDLRAYVSTYARQGIWLQVGSQTAMDGIDAVERAVHAFVSQVLGLDPLESELRLSRIDLAADVAAPMPDQATFDSGWVGRSRKMNMIGSVENPKEEQEEPSGKIEGWNVHRRRLPGSHDWTMETLYIGAPSSAIRLRVYNKLLKYDASDLAAWGCTEDELPESVSRWEWQIRARDAGFELQLEDVRDAIEGMVSGLTSWGRLTVPSETDSDHRRWELHPVFAAVLQAFISLAEPVPPLARSGAGVARVLGAGLNWSSSILAGIVARLTDPGRDPLSLSVADALQVLEEHLMASYSTGFMDRYRRRYAKEVVLAV